MPMRPTVEDAADQFTESDIVQAASDFFGMTTEAVAKAVQKTFSEQGLPDAYIKGEEGSGAFVVGLRYGSGWLIRKRPQAAEGLLAGPVDRIRRRRQCLQDLHADLQSAPRRPAVPEISRRRRQLLFHRRHRRELSALRWHHAGADAHGRRPARRRECGIPDLYARAHAQPVLRRSGSDEYQRAACGLLLRRCLRARADRATARTRHRSTRTCRPRYRTGSRR